MNRLAIGLVVVLGATASLSCRDPNGPEPTLALDPPSLTFTDTIGTANPPAKTVNVTNGGGGSLTGLAVGTISYGAGASGWLTASLGGTIAPTTLALSANLSGLVAGMYTATVPITSGVASNSPQSVSVTFVVVRPPAIALNPTSVTFTDTIGTANPPTKTVDVTNGGGGSLTVLAVGTISYGSGASGWLTATLSGTTAPATLTLAASLSGLAAGTYTATVPITSSVASNSPQTVSVTFVVVAAAPAIALSPTSVIFTDTIGTANPAAKTVDVTNGGGGSLTGLAVGTISYGSGASGWLTATLSSTTAPATLTLAANLSGLSAGSYTATVPVTSSVASNSPQSVSVTFVVVGPPAIALNPTSVTFTDTIGTANPAAKTVEVTNGGGGALTGLAVGTVSYGSGASGWLTATLSSTTAPATLTLAANLSGLSAGSYTATVPITSSVASNSPQSVSLTFVVVGPPALALNPTSATFTDTVGTANPPSQTVSVTNSGGGSLTGLAVGTISYGSGASGWLTASLGGTIAPTTLTLSANLSGLVAGTYTATVPITSGVASNSPQSVSVTFVVVGPPAAPTNLTASPVSATQINLSWTDNSENEDDFEIQRCAGGSCTNFSQVGTNSRDDFTYQDTGLNPSSTYRYRVRAWNAAGYSAYTNVASALTYPAAPTGLVATPEYYREIRLSWLPSSPADSFLVERCTGSGCSSFTELARVPFLTNAILNGSLGVGNSYRYRVRAFNSSGYSTPSNYAGVTLILSTADAAVFSNSPDQNFGTSNTLSVINDGYYAASLAGFIFFAIPQVTAARLYLYCWGRGGSSPLRVARAYQTPTWAETGVTWNNAPTATSPPSPVYVTVQDGWNAADVTQIFAGWLSATYPNNGFHLFTETGGTHALFYSREQAGFGPLLMVTY